MSHYQKASDNLTKLVDHRGGTKSWSLDQLLALAQIQATLAVADALQNKEE